MALRHRRLGLAGILEGRSDVRIQPVGLKPSPPNLPSHLVSLLPPQEAARKAAAAAAAARFRAGVAGQLEEKEAARLAVLKEKRAELVRMMADLEVS